MRLIGITGGVGSGKSEVLKYIEEHYYCRVYLADQVAHEVKKPGQPCYRQLVGLLGKGVLSPDGSIDRTVMASRIFVDRKLLQKVNDIVHPAVQQYLMDRVEEARRDPRTELFFIEAALLIETGYKDIVDEMWYVYASEGTRRQRLIKERGYTDQRVTQIMRQQLSEEAFREKSDFILDNDGPLEECLRQIDERLAPFSRREE